MQKTKPLDGKIYLKNMTTGEYTELNGVTEITSEDFGEEPFLGIPQEVADRVNEAAVAMCTAEQTLYDKIKAILMSSAIKDIENSIKDNLEDDKTPNPIYIPKHIQHRKKGRK